MRSLTRRNFLRLLPATLPALALSVLPDAVQAQAGYPFAPEPDIPAITSDSLNKRLLYLENERIFENITVKWMQFQVSALMRCFHGCGPFPKGRMRA